MTIEEFIEQLKPIDKYIYYDEGEEYTTVLLALNPEVTLSLRIYDEDKEDDPVLYSIDANGELLITNEMPLKELITCFDIINKIKKG